MLTDPGHAGDVDAMRSTAMCPQSAVLSSSFRPLSSEQISASAARAEYSGLLTGILEGFVDGVLLLNDRGEWIDGNVKARRICQQLNGGRPPESLVPEPIWQMGQLLLESAGLYPGIIVELESEISLPSLRTIHACIRWMSVEESRNPLILVTLQG